MVVVRLEVCGVVENGRRRRRDGVLAEGIIMTGVFFCLWLRERDGVEGMIDDLCGRCGGSRSFWNVEWWVGMGVQERSPPTVRTGNWGDFDYGSFKKGRNTPRYKVPEGVKVGAALSSRDPDSNIIMNY